MSAQDILLQDIQRTAGASSTSLEIIESQVHVEPKSTNFLSVYSFTTVSQRCALLVSACCAVIAGAAMPLVTVSLILRALVTK